MSAHVTTSGPLFNGAALIAASRMAAEIEETAAREGAKIVKNNLDHVLRNPTGRYESSIEASPQGGDWQVEDNGIVYGPWLEGTGSRNKTTRFKGYATFRRATAELQARMPNIARDIVRRYTKEMG